MSNEDNIANTYKHAEQWALEANPTPWAYEQACKALETQRARADGALEDIKILRLALHQCLRYIENDEVTHGRPFAAGNVARAALGMPPK